MAFESMFDLCLSQLPVAGWEAESRARGAGKSEVAVLSLMEVVLGRG